MNTKLKNKHGDIKEKFDSFFETITKEQQLKHDEYMLMAAFLAEIERIQKLNCIKRNRLASMVNISPSYLTQVFRGDKPLNFHTLAKIQRALNIRFEVNGFVRNQEHDNGNVQKLKAASEDIETLL